MYKFSSESLCIKMNPREKISLLKNITALVKKEYQSYAEQKRFFKEYNAEIQYATDSWGNDYGLLEETIFTMKDDSIIRIVKDYEMSPNIGNLYKEYPKEWENNDNLKCFISHSTAQKGRANELKNLLAPYKISGWVAHNDIKPNKYWQKEILKGLNSMDLFIALITDDFNKSIWCQQEAGFAMGRGVEIIRLKLDKADPLGFIADKQACIVQTGKTIDNIVNTIRESEIIGELYNEINPLPKIDDTDDIPF